MSAKSKFNYQQLASLIVLLVVNQVLQQTLYLSIYLLYSAVSFQVICYRDSIANTQQLIELLLQLSSKLEAVIYSNCYRESILQVEVIEEIFSYSISINFLIYNKDNSFTQLVYNNYYYYTLLAFQEQSNKVNSNLSLLVVKYQQQL